MSSDPAETSKTNNFFIGKGTLSYLPKEEKKKSRHILTAC